MRKAGSILITYFFFGYGDVSLHWSIGNVSRGPPGCLSLSEELVRAYVDSKGSKRKTGESPSRGVVMKSVLLQMFYEASCSCSQDVLGSFLKKFTSESIYLEFEWKQESEHGL